jgi:hypothetical protein
MNIDPRITYEVLREKILTFMIRRGWKDRIAKRRGFEQSLLEHSANCLDVLLTLLPTLKTRLNLAEEEEQALILGTAIHDVAKERDEWQAYIEGVGEYEPHVIPGYTVEAVEALAEWLNFEGWDDARAGANLHMKSVQTAARVFAEAQNAGPRVVLLQRLVADIDNVASANGLLAARDALARSSLDKYIHTAYHIVHVRGVSTTLLHQAAQVTFEKQGWMPLLFYPTGTLYVRSGAEESIPVVAEMVREELASAIAQVLLGKRHVLPELTVGSVISTYLPKPDLFDYRLFKDYLRVASTRAGVKPGKKINPANAQQYANFSALLKAGLDPTLVLKTQGKTGESLRAQVPEEYHHLLVLHPADIPEDETMESLNRMGGAQPEMAVFKFVKELVRSGLLDEVGITVLKQKYDGLFGSMAFEALTSTSTLMPGRDQAFTVDFFWALPLRTLGKFLQRPDLDREGTVGSLEQKRRVGLLIDTLSKIGETAFSAMENPPTVDNFAQDVAAVFIGDLLAPGALITDVQEFAEKQLRYYEQAKEMIRTKREAGHICPVCNQPFEKGTEALADFIGGTSFTGRKVAYDIEGLVICLACYYERLLRQIVLGRRAHDLIVLMPRMSLGRYGGKVLLDKLDEVRRLVKGVATADTIDPDETLRLDMTWFVARQALAADFSLMSAEDLARLFTYRSQDKTVQENLKKVIRRTREMLASDDLQEAQEWWERDFADWMEVARAITYKEMDDDVAQRIREAVYGLRPPIEFVAQTPNLVLAPSSNPRVSGKSALVESDDDSDTKAALKQLLITLAFALGLDCSVAILQDDESLDELILETGGVAYVPPLPSVRDLVARSRSRGAQQKLSPAWLSQSEAMRWLRALASVVLLADKAKYPPRNDLYQVLTVRSKGALMRRIEQKGGTMYSEDLHQLEAIGEVLR